MPRVKDLSNRLAQTCGLGDFLSQERTRIYDRASDERKEQMRAAEHAHEVYAAWNAVCGGTREGGHVTGLRYLPESNELLVYLDGPSWTQEMVMLREIVRARMEREGVKLDGLLFRTSRKDYAQRKKAVGREPEGAVKTAAPTVRRRALTDGERQVIEGATSGIENTRLREALRKAMEASATCEVAKKR